EAEAASPGAACDPMSAAEIRGAAARLARLKAAQAQIEAEDAAAAEAMAARDEAAAREAEAGRRLRGRQPTDVHAARGSADARRGYLQGYNAQVAADADQIVVAQMVSQDANDVALLGPMLELLERNLAPGAMTGVIEAVLADAGYWSDDNARLDAPGLLLIATQKDWKQRKAAQQAGTTTGEPPEGASILEAMEHRLRTAEGAAAYAKRS